MGRFNKVHGTLPFLLFSEQQIELCLDALQATRQFFRRKNDNYPGTALHDKRIRYLRWSCRE